jgi:hypothetical protein
MKFKGNMGATSIVVVGAKYWKLVSACDGTADSIRMGGCEWKVDGICADKLEGKFKGNKVGSSVEGIFDGIHVGVPVSWDVGELESCSIGEDVG